MKTTRRSALFAVSVAGFALAMVGLVAWVRLLLGHLVLSAEVASAVVVLGLVSLVLAGRQARRVAPVSVLELDMPVAPSEVAPRNPLAIAGGRRSMPLGEMVKTIARASADQRVKGLVLQPRFSGAPQAVVQELRDAIGAFRAAGKFAVAFCDTFGEGAAANAGYYLASACDEVVVSPTGMVGLVPLAREANFYRGLLDRVGVEFEVVAREEYKSAFSQLSGTEFSDADRAQRQRLLESLWQQQVEAVAAARHLEPDEVRHLADRAPLTAAEALQAGLVDRLAYADEVLAGAKQLAGPRAKLLYLAEYKKRSGHERRRGKTVTVGVVRAVGEVHRSSDAPMGLTGGPVMAADRLGAQLRAAAKDKKAKAFVLRIDSPGGSAVASETIWRELVNLKSGGRPLVVSMGAVAASGGYYLAAAGDRIVAQPGTITGSIGVITMHPVLAEAKQRLGVSADEVHTGADRSPYSVNRPYSQAQLSRVNALIDEIYGVFTQRVADGRKMGLDQVLAVAKGRVWTGADAVGIGLADQLGGLEQALRLAVELTGAPAGSVPQARDLPRRRPRWRGLRRPQSSDDAPGAPAAGHRTWWPGDAPALGPASSVLGLFSGARASHEVLCHLGHDPKGYWLP